MNSTISLIPEKHFLCSLCKDIFTSPVTIPCGHSFCKACLCQYWSQHHSCCCPHCRRVFSTRPDISVNRILADVAENYRKCKPQTSEDEMVIDVGQMIFERQQKIERLKEVLQIQKNSCLREVRESHKVFSALVNSIEKGHKAVVTTIEERQREEEKKAEAIIRELEQEIKQLKRQNAGFKGSQFHLDCDDSIEEEVAMLHITSDMRDWSKVTMEPDLCLGIARRALSDVMDKIRAEVNRLSKNELKRIQKHAVEVNLSAKTAHPVLAVSEDRKQVRCTDKFQEVPDNPKRFDRVANILGRESFSSGKHYWEVEVGDKTEWNLGVVKQSINRKGKFTVCPANGFWTVCLTTRGQYVANTSPVTPLGLDEIPTKVAVFLDYMEGRVSFYSVDTGVHIYTFTDTFNDRLHPFFSPGRVYGGKNTAPLIITSNFCSI